MVPRMVKTIYMADGKITPGVDMVEIDYSRSVIQKIFASVSCNEFHRIWMHVI